MESRHGVVMALDQWISRHFLWLLLDCYGAAALWPGPGLSLRGVSFGRIDLFGQSTPLTLTMLMLALLLLNAGLAVQHSKLRRLPRAAPILLVGLAANLLIPVTVILGVIPLTSFWLNAEEMQSLLLGLAIIAAMPIAGSSTAWSQSVGGNLALSLSLVVTSTLISPLSTPAALRVMGVLAAGDDAADLDRLAQGGAGLFLVICVVAPSLLGILLGSAIGEGRLDSAKPYLKLVNALDLLLLIYANAAGSLPEAIAYPDPDFLLTTLAVTVLLCSLAFASGWGVARLFGADLSDRAALMFGLGMNNNGTGLVLASVALADHPRVLLPIILYNLVQHLLAGAVAAGLRPRLAVDRRVNDGSMAKRCGEAST